MKGEPPGPGDGWRPPRGHKAPRTSFRAPDVEPRRRWPFRYHHYHYYTAPRYYIYGGWGGGWYDPWWYGNYWWPAPTRYETRVYHYYHYYDTDRSSPYYETARWMDTDLQTALTDIAVAWSTGDVELLQAHLTPGVGVAIRYDWDQEEPWVLASPVFLDIALEAMDAMDDSEFRFVQVEEVEPGLVWAVAEHDFREDGQGRQQATMEYMLRQYDDAWLVEAITASPQKYWWLDSDLLSDAASESARLFEEMSNADVW